MFIAHAPSGYVLAASLARRAPPAVFAAAMLGAIAPDLDLAWFHLVDARQTHHHRYVTHWPVLWLALSLTSTVWLYRARTSVAALAALVFSLGGLLHMALDSVVGDIWWLAPFADQPYALFKVTARFKPWWLNFLLHWTFAVELAICASAAMVYRRRANGGRRYLAAKQ